jgi:RNA polymerase subunit RPABC4/transcription elongation factor Spt4
MRVAWNIGDWGAACGPRPSEQVAPAGKVTVAERGGELTFQDSGRAYSTTQCWERYPGLTAVSHSGGSRGWRTVCKTPPSDPRQATITTTLNASDTDIVFDEAGQYQFVVGGQNCTASIRRSRSFHLLQREGEPRAAAVPSTATAPRAEPSAEQVAPARAPPSTTSPQRCERPGPPARLEVRPSRKLMQPGEEFQFRTLVLDAKGCPLNLVATWAAPGQTSEVKLLGGGKVRVAGDAPEGEVPLTATVEGQSARVVVEVASHERYEAMLNAGRFDRTGETPEVSVAVIASGSIGARAADSDSAVSARRRAFVAVLGGVLLLGMAGIVVAFRVRRASRMASGASSSVLEISLPRPRAMLCPTCQRVCPPEAEFCPADGDRLVAPESPGEAPAGFGGEVPVPASLPEAVVGAAAEMGKKICPVCGVQYPGEAQFCGADGAHLVPLN